MKQVRRSFITAFSICMTVPLRLENSTSQNIRKTFLREYNKLFWEKNLRLGPKSALSSPIYYYLTQEIAERIFKTRTVGKAVSIAELNRRIILVKVKVVL